MGSVEQDPPGTAEAAEGLAYVADLLEDLESLMLKLRGLPQMNWRSDAAEEFAEYLSGCVQRVAQTAGEYETAAELLQGYGNELRLLGAEDWS